MSTHAYPQRPARWAFGMPEWAVIVLAVVVLAAALGAGVLIGRNTVSAEPARTQAAPAPAPAPAQVGQADATTVKMIDAMNEAAGTDGKRFAAFFTPTGVLEEVGIGKVTTGRAAIARHQQGYIDDGFWVQADGPVIQRGNFVAYAIIGQSFSTGMGLLQLTPRGKVQHAWALVA